MGSPDKILFELINMPKISALLTSRPLVIGLFLLVVNLSCGFIAVEFRYPSLWGGGNVFAEYALPLHLSWGFAHLPSMVTLSIVLFLMPGWTEAQIRKGRCFLLAAIGLCIGIEFMYGGGRFHRIPFVLFVLVDVTAVYVLSLLLYKRRRPYFALFSFVVITLVLAAPTLRFEYQKYLYDQKRIQAIEREAERSKRINGE